MLIGYKEKEHKTMINFFRQWKFTDTKTLIVLAMAFGLLFIEAVYGTHEYIEY